MSPALDMLRVSTIAEELADAGREIFEGLFDTRGHKTGGPIIRPGGKEPG